MLRAYIKTIENGGSSIDLSKRTNVSTNCIKSFAEYYNPVSPVVAMTILPDNRFVSANRNTIKVEEKIIDENERGLYNYKFSFSENVGSYGISSLEFCCEHLLGGVTVSNKDSFFLMCCVETGKERMLISNKVHQQRISAFKMIENSERFIFSAEGDLMIYRFISQPTMGISEIKRSSSMGVGTFSSLELLTNKIACGFDSGNIRILDSTSLDTILTWSQHKGRVNSIIAISDNQIISGSEDKTIKIWDLRTKKSIDGFSSEGEISVLTVLSNGHLAFGEKNTNIIEIWDVAARSHLGKLEGHDGAITALKPLPGGKLASGSVDGTIKIWQASTEKLKFIDIKPVLECLKKPSEIQHINFNNIQLTEAATEYLVSVINQQKSLCTMHLCNTDSSTNAVVFYLIRLNRLTQN